ncbi:MAG: DUF167 domain-containing protein [Rhodospirillaceae bacterium]|nr:DUF167 domain-containing protein [Rhodospirillaceae bacterium]MBL6942576.1 DUF167 domain-containing protein [Rhodospirillales bacterium]
MSPCSPFSGVQGGVRVRLRLNPKASANRISGLTTDPDGNAVLKATVTAVPEDGKANAALIKMLAREWKLAKSGFDIIHGATGQNKTVFVAGGTEQLLKKLQNWASHKLGNETS